ncbi:MAG: hypothetical protein AAF267_10745 [Deinococcota bacterium]
MAVASSQRVSKLTHAPGYYLGDQQLIKTAKQAILCQLEQTPTPLRVRDLIQQTGLESCNLKRALWSLVDEGRVSFTEDRRVCKHA